MARRAVAKEPVPVQILFKGSWSMRVTRRPIFDIRHRSVGAWSRYLFVNRAFPINTMGSPRKKGPSLARVTLCAHLHPLFG